MSSECQVSVKSQSELDIGGRETCLCFYREVKLSNNRLSSFPINLANLPCLVVLDLSQNKVSLDPLQRI